MDQAALQVVHHIKTDQDLFLIDFKYIKDVIATKLTHPVAPKEFNFVLSELSSVNATLRRPTIACICRASAVNIDAQNLRVNVDENFYERFFKIFQGLKLSTEDMDLIEKAHDACVRSLPVKKMEKETADEEDYYEKYDDDRYDDEDSQSKHTFENKNFNTASYVDDSFYSDATPHIEGGTTSKVFTASEYDNQDHLEQTDYAEHKVMSNNHQEKHNEQVNDNKEPTSSDSYYDDNDFEDSDHATDSAQKTTQASVVSQEVEKVSVMKESTVSDSYYEDNDFEDSTHVDKNNSKDNGKETETDVANAFISAQYDSTKKNMNTSVEVTDMRESTASGVYYDNDFEESADLEDPKKLVMNEEPSKGSEKVSVMKESTSSNSYYDNDFEDSEPPVGRDSSINEAKNEKETADLSNTFVAAQYETPEENKLNAASTLSHVDYDVSDFEESITDKPEKNPTSTDTDANDDDNHSHKSANVSCKSSKSGVVEVIKRGAVLLDPEQKKDLVQLQTSDDDFDFPNLETIHDSVDSDGSVVGNLPVTQSETSPEGRDTKYGSMARRDSMLTFLNVFAPGVHVESDDEQESNEEDGKDLKGQNHSQSSSSTQDSMDILVTTPAPVAARESGQVKEKENNEDKDRYNDSDEDAFYEDHGDDFEESHVHFSPLKEIESESIFSPEKEAPVPIPYPEEKVLATEDRKDQSGESTLPRSFQRPLSANPNTSISLVEGETKKERPFSAQGSPSNAMERYASKPRASAMFQNSGPKKTIGIQRHVLAQHHQSPVPTQRADSTKKDTKDSITVESQSQPPAIAPSTPASSDSIEQYASKSRGTAMFVNHAKKTIQMAKYVNKLASRPASAPLSGPINTPDPSMIERRLSPPRQALISDHSQLLIKTISYKQDKRPMSADNTFMRGSGTMVRSASAGTTRPSRHSIKYAERIAAARLAGYTFDKKPPVPVHAFSGCVKPAHKGHVFDAPVVPKKPHIPLDAFANTIKPENPGHELASTAKPPLRPHVPFNEFEPPPEKKLPVVDESKPVKNLMAFYRLIKNKIVIVENTVKCVHDLCKEETFKALGEKYAEREEMNERELTMISRNSRNAISSNTKTFAKTIQAEVTKYQQNPQPGKRTFTQDHADRFRKFIRDSKESSFHSGRHCMSQATLRHDKELKALEASLREPTNRIRKYFDTKSLLLSQVTVRNNSAYDHFKNMLAAMDSINKETQQGRVHRAAVECHTILFCCLETVNEIDTEVQELNTKMMAVMDNEEEVFNFSATNSVHFFPPQFHQYFGNLNATPVSAIYAPKKLKKKVKKSRKQTAGNNHMNEQDAVEPDADADAVFLTQELEEDEDEGEEEKDVVHQNQGDDDEIQEEAKEKECADDEEHENGSPPESQHYNKKAIMDLLAEWLAEQIDEEKTAEEWLGTAIAVMTSADSTQVLRSGSDDQQMKTTDHAHADETNNERMFPESGCIEKLSEQDPIIACLAEWLEEGLHVAAQNGHKTATQWIAAATKCVFSQTKKTKYTKKKRRKKKEPLQPEPCTYCMKKYRGEGKTLPTKLSSGSHASNPARNKPTNEIHFLQYQKTQNFKFSKGRANDKLFCSWECTRQWNAEHTPVLHRYDTEQLIRIAAGKFKLSK